jgi:hypothetical protein
MMTLSMIWASVAQTLENAGTVITLSHSKQPPVLRLFKANAAGQGRRKNPARKFVDSADLVLDLFW